MSEQNNDVDPREFRRIPATDDKGHSERIWFRVMPIVAARISKIVNGKQFPYPSKEAFIRHAIIRHLRWLESLKPEVKSVSGQVGVMLEIIQEHNEAIEFKQVFDELMDVLGIYNRHGHEGQARKLVLDVQELINGMPDGYWKKQYSAELETKCGKLLNVRMDLMETEENGDE